LREPLRLDGRIMGATVRREADNWYVSLQVELTTGAAVRARTGDGVIGVDLGISAAATLSTGEAIASPRPLKAALRRLRIRSRRASRKFKAAKVAAGICGAIPKGTRLPVSKNRTKGAQALARLHARVAAVRSDFTHKLTTRLCRENQTVVIEDLHVKGWSRELERCTAPLRNEPALQGRLPSPGIIGHAGQWPAGPFAQRHRLRPDSHAARVQGVTLRHARDGSRPLVRQQQAMFRLWFQPCNAGLARAPGRATNVVRNTTATTTRPLIYNGSRPVLQTHAAETRYPWRVGR
jgi:hypothetical protein